MKDYSSIIKFLDDNRDLLRRNDFDGLYKAYSGLMTDNFKFGQVIDFFLTELNLNVLKYFSTLDYSMFTFSESQ